LDKLFKLNIIGAIMTVKAILLREPYRADHSENRMKHEGDVGRAREYFYSTGANNLKRLIQNRFEWMNEYITRDAVGVEVGCGTGVSKDYVKAKEYRVSDFADHAWLDLKNVDALNTGFEDNSFDFVVSSNMVHHVPYPVRFFEEMSRILKPGGVLLIQEINASLFMRVLLRLMRHEGYSFEVDVFNRDVVCTDPNDLWSANCAIPNLLFDDEDRFHSNVKQFRIEHKSFSEFFTFINSGGVIAKTAFIPLPVWGLKVIEKIDGVLANALPSVFALQRQIVLRKVANPA
jgi:SAM-dependent methyltransferase